MKFLVYGGGTIGLSYAWLLSSAHQVDVLFRPSRAQAARQGFDFTVRDLRGKTVAEKRFHYQPQVVTEMNGAYQAVLVTVNRTQLASALPALQACPADIIFMQNHWDIQRELAPYLEPSRYLLGFPSQIGGGREGARVEVNLYGEGTVLGEADGAHSPRLERYKTAFEQAGLAVEVKSDMLDWMRVHYLQQSISAGAVLKAGSYQAFAASYPAVKEMVYAFREGVAVCAGYGVNTKKVFPASLFRLPAPLVARVMKRMLSQPDTAAMVTGHMKQGLPEWVAGYYEVLESGREKSVPMPVWASYRPYVDAYIKQEEAAP